MRVVVEQHEFFPVRHHQADNGAQGFDELLVRVREPGRCCLDSAVVQPHQALAHHVQDVVLAGDVVVEVTLGDTGRQGDVLGGRDVVALAPKDLDGGADDEVAPLLHELAVLYLGYDFSGHF